MVSIGFQRINQRANGAVVGFGQGQRHHKVAPGLLNGSQYGAFMVDAPIAVHTVYVIAEINAPGLTAGLTPSLSSVGKCVIILLMYMGRLSPVTLALLFAGKMGKRGKGRKLPEERIMVG